MLCSFIYRMCKFITTFASKPDCNCRWFTYNKNDYQYWSQDYPLNITYGMGGLFDNRVPIICGGWDSKVNWVFFKLWSQVVNKFYSRIDMLCRNKVLWLDVHSHVTSFNQIRVLYFSSALLNDIVFQGPLQVGVGNDLWRQLWRVRGHRGVQVRRYQSINQFPASFFFIFVFSIQLKVDK